MAFKKKILIVEDELIIAETIVEILRAQGYEKTFVAESVEEAKIFIEKENPDLVFTDIALKSNQTGIDLGHLLFEKYKIPFIYITSHVSSQIIQKAKATFPNAFLSKPFKKEDLLIAMEFAFHKADSAEVEDDCLYVKDGHETVRIPYDEIIYLKADRNYTSIFPSEGKVRLVRFSLAEILSQLPEETFLRIHKSYVVNLKQILSVKSSRVLLADMELPVGRSYRETLSYVFNK
ncbi:MAG: DNA-binding response regulator [Bacteroidetes bacterium]|jgi:DNA-binding LytR/AlgR family response regulator|nr:DNA-binding response regulator [Bacteroidota bacterium]